VHCTLLGGLKKGQLFDVLKMKTLTVSSPLSSEIKFHLVLSDLRGLWH
jgi:hypothetical protein